MPSTKNPATVVKPGPGRLPASVATASIFAYDEDLDSKIGFSHSLLSDLTDPGCHPALAIETDPTNFDKILSASDTDAQKAFETLDGHTHAATDALNDTSNFDKILSAADTDAQKAFDTLDNHTHVALDVSNDTSNFDKILSSSDTDAQKAFETIDEHVHPAADITVDTAPFTTILSASDVEVQHALKTLDVHTHSGGGGSAPIIAARYYLDADVTVSSTESRVDFASKTFDTDDAVTTGSSWVFTAPTNGVYFVTATVRFSSVGWETSEKLLLRFARNGITSAEVSSPNYDIGLDIKDESLNLAEMMQLSGGDTVYATLTRPGVGSDVVVLGSTQSYIAISKLGDAGGIYTANGIATNTTFFDTILSPADTNVQKALDTIDKHTHTGVSLTTYATPADLSASPSPINGGKAYVTDLGIYEYIAGATEPPDNEFVIDAPSGRWFLRIPHGDAIFAYIQAQVNSLAGKPVDTDLIDGDTLQYDGVFEVWRLIRVQDQGMVIRGLPVDTLADLVDGSILVYSVDSDGWVPKTPTEVRALLGL